MGLNLSSTLDVRELTSQMLSESDNGISSRCPIRTEQCLQSDDAIIKLYNYYLLTVYIQRIHSELSTTERWLYSLPDTYGLKLT